MGKILKKKSYSLVKNIAFSLKDCGEGCTSCSVTTCTCGSSQVTIDTSAGYEGAKAAYVANKSAQAAQG